jgi:methyl-accepting chemotaxis protein
MIEIAGRKISLGKKHIVVYENIGFLGKDAIESRKYAIYELQELIKRIEDLLVINLRPHIFSVAREHYGLINNLLAMQCNKQGKPLRIKDLEGYWLITDDSFNLDELETIGKKSFDNMNLGIQKWYNSFKNHKFKVTADFILESFNNQNNQIDRVTQNQVMFAKNIEKHMQVLEEMSMTLKEIRKEIKKKKGV